MATKKENEQGYVALDTSGNDYAGMVGMSDLDRAALSAAQQSWTDANVRGDQAGMDAAHQQAEQIRAKYGYSGGNDGTQYLPSQQFSYASAPTYTSKYQDQINALMEQILGRERFSYDPENDPSYAAYRREYAREGQRAAADAMGQYAAMTGGMPSTAAITASQQAGDYYVAQMADKIPELQQLAYSMYMDEGNNMRANMDMLLALEQGDYNQYLNLLNQYNTDRSFAYGTWADQRDYDYQKSRDDISDQRYADEWAYQQERDALSRQQTEQNFYQQQLDAILQAGGSPSADLVAQSGYSNEYVQALENYYKQQAAAAAAKVYSGGGGGDSAPSLTWPQTLAQIEAGNLTPNVLSAYQYYMGEAYGDADVGTEAEEAVDREASQEGTNPEKTVIGNLKKTVNVPGYGELDFEAAEKLEQLGYIELLGVDSKGDPVYRRLAKKNISDNIEMLK